MAGSQRKSVWFCPMVICTGRYVAGSTQKVNWPEAPVILMVLTPSITCLPATVYAPQASWDRMKAGQPLPAPPAREITRPWMQLDGPGPLPPWPPGAGAAHQVSLP